ncbi:hypothetical protein LX69_03290 [Breznakibacter xylanolyticus]|uniref:SPOR domain-containing protein n=1 Tax=Breznakibacter xylanolyticus TaxID=990 RepID=A0A2W7PN93_9BACT|nr:SPOR domain-containing protein [Breznakibacter xylanolyticus]PZX10829.1 hypothetical protein LX69_03290 [Breznakibacter xylanolyticus]
MNTTGKYISDLIILHDCVIVPGLGGFVSNYLPAGISEEKGLFMPPQKEVGFNRSLMHNDGLLVNHVAMMSGVGYAEAAKQVDVYVQTIMATLAEGRVATIGDLGMLRRDMAGNVLFVPSPQGVINPDAFGLAPVHYSLSELLDEKKPESSVSRAFTLPRFPHRQVAVGLALVAGLFMLTPSVNTPKAISQGALVDLPALNLMASPVEVEESEVDVDTTLAIEATELLREQADVRSQEAALAVVQEEPAWYLIAASFPAQEPAHMHCEKLRHGGYPNARVVVVDGKNRVAVDFFHQRAEALQAMAQYRAIKGFDSVWLLRNKSN